MPTENDKKPAAKAGDKKPAAKAGDKKPVAKAPDKIAAPMDDTAVPIDDTAAPVDAKKPAVKAAAKKPATAGKESPLSAPLSAPLEPPKTIEGFPKAPGQTGLHAPRSIDAIRRPRPEERVDKGDRYFGGVSEAKRVDQASDLYNPSSKTKADSAPKKKPPEEEE